MRSVLHGFIGAVVLLAVALPAVAATPSEFYLATLRRGITAYEAGRFDAAAGPLKIAAFGLVDSIEHYQTAQIHLALTHDRMSEPELARESARRVVVAERVEARYSSLPLRPDTRSNFEALARRSLTAADLAILGRSAQGMIASQPATPVQTPATTTTTTTPAPVPLKPDPVVTRPEPVASNPAPVETRSEPVEMKPEPVAPKPDPVVVKPDPVPVKVEPPPQKSNPPALKPQPPAPVRTTPARPPINVAASFTAAEEALTASQLIDARAIYRQLLDDSSLQRADILRLAEGFYRSRDFANALRAFERLGPLRRGEEPYRYYIAVALYETGQYARAKDELAGVLPFIEETPDVTRYRVKIEGARN